MVVLAVQQVRGERCLVPAGRRQHAAARRVHVHQCFHVHGQGQRELRVVESVGHAQAGGVRQVERPAEAVPGRGVDPAAHPGVVRQRRQRDGSGVEDVELGQLVGQALPPVARRAGQQQDPQPVAGRLPVLAHQGEQVRQRPALRVVDHQHQAGMTHRQTLVPAAGRGHLAAVPRLRHRPSGPHRARGELGGQPGLAPPALGVQQTHRQARRRVVAPGGQQLQLRSREERDDLVPGRQQPAGDPCQAGRGSGRAPERERLDPVGRLGTVDVVVLVAVLDRVHPTARGGDVLGEDDALRRRALAHAVAPPSARRGVSMNRLC